VKALFFTAMRSACEKGLDCSLGNSERRKANLENRALVARTFGIEAHHLLTTKQTRPEVIIVAQGWNHNLRPAAHGIVMAHNYDHVIGVLTSDCAPVLFMDTQNAIAGAAHIGWREAAQQVLEHTVDAMVCLGSKRENILACIGPCAGVERTYEVSNNFARLPPNNDSEIEDFLFQNASKTFFDLPGYVEHRLRRKAGLSDSAISRIAVDTIANDNCYSLRRDEKGNGTMFSGIKLMKPAGR
jgi:YfiH family protein